MPVCGDADVTPVVRSNELDECSRPAEWAVDPGLAGLLHHLEYDLVVGARDNILDDGTVGGPLIRATAVRSGCAARSIPAVITGQPYCDRNLKATYFHAAFRCSVGPWQEDPGRVCRWIDGGSSTQRHCLQQIDRPVGHLANSALSRCGHVRWEYCRAWSFYRWGYKWDSSPGCLCREASAVPCIPVAP